MTEAPGRQSSLDLAIGLGLILSIFIAYSQVSRFDFVNYDDDTYVYDNIHVQDGLTPASIRWAFTAVVSNNWMPVTLLSHLLDVQLFHLQSGMHHLVNVLWHALSAVLLFVVMKRATRARWPSALVAFVFALHPLHVGSVAWVAERKDLLSGFFCFLALYCYVRYAERPGPGRYALVVAAFCLGLMSKPMLVTFPFVLLLFDVWPLRRVQWPKILWEKLPLIALSAAASMVTYLVQQSTGAVKAIPLALRVENALLSYAVYIGQMFWPARLAVFYPYPQSIAAWQVGIAAAVIVSVSGAAIYVWRKRPTLAPYFPTGWFWYLGMLVPVIGLVQVGPQSHADRYMYLPMVGLSMILAWGAADAVRKWPRTKPAIVAAAAICCVAYMAATWKQSVYWQNSETLFQHALDVTEDNWVDQYNLGYYLMKTAGRPSDAIPHFAAARRFQPDHADTNANLAFCLMNSGRAADAIPYFEAVLRLEPDSADAHSNLAVALSKVPGRTAEAITHFEAALRLQPGNAGTTNNLGACLLKSGRTADAIPYFETALRLKPDFAEAHFNLGQALSHTPGRTADAIPQFEAALRLRPDYPAAQHSLALLLMQRGRTE